jgi:hypothetical protein
LNHKNALAQKGFPNQGDGLQHSVANSGFQGQNGAFGVNGKGKNGAVG